MFQDKNQIHIRGKHELNTDEQLHAFGMRLAVTTRALSNACWRVQVARWRIRRMENIIQIRRRCSKWLN